MKLKIPRNGKPQNYDHKICTESLKFPRTQKMKHIMQCAQRV